MWWHGQLWMDKLARHGQVTGTSVVPQAPPQAAADGTAAGASTAGTGQGKRRRGQWSTPICPAVHLRETSHCFARLS